MSRDLFDASDVRENKRAREKLKSLAEQMKAGLDDGDKQNLIDSGTAFTVDTSKRMTLKWWKKIGHEPVVSGGILLSPEIVDYGQRASSAMKEHAKQADDRARREAGKPNDRKQKPR